MPRSASWTQLPLRLRFPDSACFEDFAGAANAEAVSALGRLAQGAGERVFLWGAAHSGKTHLLQACCTAAGARQRRAAYVPLREAVRVHEPTLLDGLESCALICLDDVDALGGAGPWEHAVLHLYNRAADAGRALVLSARRPPAEVQVALADLRSRLAWGLTLRLQPLADEDKHRVLQQRARRRGFELPDAVAAYMLSRHRRDFPSLLALLDRLDAASLAAQRRLTIPFVRTLIAP